MKLSSKLLMAVFSSAMPVMPLLDFSAVAKDRDISKTETRRAGKMDLEYISTLLPGTFNYEGVTVQAWSGEPQYAALDAVVVRDDSVKTITVGKGQTDGQKIIIRIPFNPADSVDSAAKQFMENLSRITDICSRNKAEDLAVSVEELSGMETLSVELCREITARLYQAMKAGKPVKNIVLASLDKSGAVRKGINSLVTTLKEQPGKTYVPVHPENSIRPVADCGGKLEMKPLENIVSGEYGTWTLTYTVGRGLGQNAEIIFALTHPTDWQPPQFAVPESSGYTTATTSGKAKLLLLCEPANGNHGFILHVSIRDGMLEKGDTVTVTLGDRSFGSPGLQAQSRDQVGQCMKVFGDFEDTVKIYWQHNDWTMGLKDSPVFDVLTGPPSLYHVVIPSDTVIGQPFKAIVRVCDKMGNLYSGPAIEMRLAVPGGELKSCAVRPEDRGHIAIPGLRLEKKGVNRLILSDSSGRQLALSNPTICRDSFPENRIFWGDLHMHSNLSDGLGDPDDVYAYAKNVSGLDIAALADHDFILGKNNSWEKIKELARRWHDPGNFVTLLGYEYTERIHGGDRNVYYLGDDGPFINCTEVKHPSDLYKLLKQGGHKAIVIPHCTVGNPGIWKHSDPEFCPLAEIYSVHGNSDAYPNSRPLHAWGKSKNVYGPGTCYSESFAEGLRMGVVGGTDDHGAQPGWGYSWHDYRGGIMGVFMKDLTRQSLWESLWEKRTIATTGERIILDMKVDGVEIGRTGKATAEPMIEITAHGTAKIDMIEILRNEQIIHCFHGTGMDEHHLFKDRIGEDKSAWYRCRLTQSDGEMAWTSPVWLDALTNK